MPRSDRTATAPSLLFAPLFALAACGGTHVGEVPTTHLLRTALRDDATTIAKLGAAARAEGCVLRALTEPTSRMFATCDEVGVLFTSGPWAGVLSVQCVETPDDTACAALAERLARAAMGVVPRPLPPD
jgi:hypothetical protein